DMYEAIEKIERFLCGLDRDAFLQDDRTVDAVVRNLEIIGEAAGRLSEEFRSSHPGIEWRRMVGLRNRIVHDYFGIDLEIVWTILEQELPGLKEKIRLLRTTP
ncbi:MAG TPA: DUF86 domain-containing protein, partial [Myxococcota bacterium]